MRIGITSGLWLRHDGISNSVSLKIDLIDRLHEAGVSVGTTVFAEATDHPDPRARVHGSLHSLLADPVLRGCDVHMFEFGIRYALFDALPLVSVSTPTVGVFHNVTPGEFAETVDEFRVIERSLAQMHHLRFAHHVMCVSEFNRQTLLAAGFPDEKLSVVPFPHDRVGSSGGVAQRNTETGMTEFLFVGRIAPAKGVRDLLNAWRAVIDAGTTRARLTIAGSAALSDPALLGRVQREAAEGGGRADVRLILDPDDSRLAEIYAGSHCLVIPSYHEGFCIPVVEALSAGCYVIGSDAGNLPFIIGECGTVVPVGDSRALAAAMLAFATSSAGHRPRAASALPCPGEPSGATWSARVQEHLRPYSRASYEVAVVRSLQDAFSTAGVSPPSALSQMAALVGDDGTESMG